MFKKWASALKRCWTITILHFRHLSQYTEITVGGKCENRWKDTFGSNVTYLSRSTFTDNELIGTTSISYVRTTYYELCQQDSLSPLYFATSLFSATHRFYIAFENSACNDYITEKYFLRLSQLLVPVVLNRSILEGDLIRFSVMHVRQDYGWRRGRDRRDRHGGSVGLYVEGDEHSSSFHYYAWPCLDFHFNFVQSELWRCWLTSAFLHSVGWFRNCPRSGRTS